MRPKEWRPGPPPLRFTAKGLGAVETGAAPEPAAVLWFGQGSTVGIGQTKLRYDDRQERR